MNLRILNGLMITVLAGWSSDQLVSMEGYGEAYAFMMPDKHEEVIADLSIEPTLHLSDTVKLHAVIGLAHPSENGDPFEAELEVLSLDAAVSPDTALSFGKVHMPVGLYNLYHEPIYFLTIEPSRVEHLIIPAEWHETAALVSHKVNGYEITAGLMSGMNAKKLERDTWIREGKESHLTGGGKPGYVVRLDYGTIEKLLVGGSAVYTPLSESSGKATLVEIHAAARFNNGFEAMGILSKGWISDIESVRNAAGTDIAQSAKGVSLTVGYDIGKHCSLPERTIVAFAHGEYAKPVESMSTSVLGGRAYSGGMDWFITPRIVAKAEVRDSSREGTRIGGGIGFVY